MANKHNIISIEENLEIIQQLENQSIFAMTLNWQLKVHNKGKKETVEKNLNSNLQTIDKAVL